MYKAMANLSIRMLSVFLFVGVLLNIMNYLFVRVYNPPYHNDFNYKYPKTARSPSRYHIILTSESRAKLFVVKSCGIEFRRSPIKGQDWSTNIQCPNKEKASVVRRKGNNNTMQSETDISTYSAYYLILDKTRTTVQEIEFCPEIPPGLGPEIGDRELILRHGQSPVKPGGIYHPTSCKSLQSVAIIMAYRGCKVYLATFLNILHPFLIKQQLDYQIFVVEQSNSSQPFNRGKLLNVGFTEARRYRKQDWQCIIIHEPHVVPMDSRNLYRCSWYPRQLATSVERPFKARRRNTNPMTASVAYLQKIKREAPSSNQKSKQPRSSYKPLLGGALAMTPEQYLKVNGFSNAYWGNDADYYDLHHRFNSSYYFIENSYPLVGRYKTLRRGVSLWQKSEYLASPSPLFLLDGLTSLSYTVDTFELKRLYTYLQVNIDATVENKSKAKLYEKLINADTPQTTPPMK